jgi:hypothetical protein
VNTYVLYKYRAPGSSREVNMKTDTIPYEPDKALYLIHRVGETFPLWPDHPEEHGHQPKESRVLEWRLDTTRENRVVVIVTDPDDDG